MNENSWPIRPVTEALFDAIMLDVWPDSPAAIEDFGLETQAHFEALYYPILAGEITIERLDEALGSGPKLTTLVQSAPSNPHKKIVFQTPYDLFSGDFGERV